MKITRNELHNGRAVIEAEFNIERGWVSQYPEYAIVVQTGNPPIRIGENYYSRPELRFTDIGPSIKPVTGNVDFPAKQDQSVIVMIYTREDPSSKWEMRYNRSVQVGFGQITEEKTGDWTESMKPVLYGLLAVGGVWGASKLIQAVKA